MFYNNVIENGTIYMGYDLYDRLETDDNGLCNKLLRIGEDDDYIDGLPTFLMHLDEFVRKKSLFSFFPFITFLALEIQKEII